jgi:hypothetical protein
VFNLVPGLFAIFLFVLVSAAGLVLVQRLVPIELRKQHNDVAGFIYAVLGSPTLCCWVSWPPTRPRRVGGLDRGAPARLPCRGSGSGP